MALLISQPSYSRSPPKKLTSDRERTAVEIITYLKSKYPKEDPLLYVAVALVESSLKPTAVSHTGDYGVLQVNCRIHKKKLREILGIHNCKKEMLNIKKNVDASVLIFNRFKRYKTCKKDYIFSCYNAGQGWRSIKKRCLSSCSQDSCKKCNRPDRYRNTVKKFTKFLEKNYSYLF